jgi:hypothetical protein
LDKESSKLPIETVARLDVSQLMADYEAQLVSSHTLNKRRMKNQISMAMAYGISVHKRTVSDIHIGNRTRQNCGAAYDQPVQ